MKIETELRHIIVATARANAKLPNDSHKNNQYAVDAFLATPKGKKAKKQIMDLQAQIDDLEVQQAKLSKRRNEIQAPLGLDLCGRRDKQTGKNEQYLRLGYGDDEKMAFVASGGVLPAPERRNWSSDELLRRLVAAKDQKAFDAILKEYGINWT